MQGFTLASSLMQRKQNFDANVDGRTYGRTNERTDGNWTSISHPALSRCDKINTKHYSLNSFTLEFTNDKTVVNLERKICLDNTLKKKGIGGSKLSESLSKSYSTDVQGKHHFSITAFRLHEASRASTLIYPWTIKLGATSYRKL